MARIELRGVVLRAGEVTILGEVDLAVWSGEVLAVIGPSGSGKTALLRVVAGLEHPTEGTATIDGDPASAPGRLGRTAMVAQGDPLYRHLTVGGNVAFPLRAVGDRASAADRRARRRLRNSGVLALWHRTIDTLSGGERGLVSLARAIARRDVTTLLLDEPLATADQRTRRQFWSELRRLRDETGLSVLLATSDQEQALAVGDRVAVLVDGRLRQVDEPAVVYRRPIDLTVAGFVGSPPMNLFPARMIMADDRNYLELGTDRLVLDGETVPGVSPARVVVGIRPEELKPAPPGAPFHRVMHVTVGSVERTGARSVVRFGLGTAGSTAYGYLADPDTRIAPGDRQELIWTLDRPRLYSAQTGQAIPM